MDNKFITDVIATNSPDGNILVCGFFSPTNYYSAKGVFYMQVNDKGGVINNTVTEFDQKFIAEYHTGENSSEFHYLNIDDLLVKSDGDIILIAEQYHVVVPYENEPPVPRMKPAEHGNDYTCYEFGDIIILNFNTQGEMTWNDKIPKEHYTGVDNGDKYSYKYTIVGDKIYFFYNENKENLNLKPDEKLHGYIPDLLLVEVDDTGKTSGELLFDSSNSCIVVFTQLCVPAGGKILLYKGDSPNCQVS